MGLCDKPEKRPVWSARLIQNVMSCWSLTEILLHEVFLPVVYHILITQLCSKWAGLWKQTCFRWCVGLGEFPRAPKCGSFSPLRHVPSHVFILAFGKIDVCKCEDFHVVYTSLEIFLGSHSQRSYESVPSSLSLHVFRCVCLAVCEEHNMENVAVKIHL